MDTYIHYTIGLPNPSIIVVQNIVQDGVCLVRMYRFKRYQKYTISPAAVAIFKITYHSQR